MNRSSALPWCRLNRGRVRAPWGRPEPRANTDLLYTESKTEVNIDRITSKANPRTFERIPAGAKFNLTVILNIFEGENEDGLKKTFTQAINLLHDDYLGGQGSRGYGQVKIEWSSIEEKKVEDYLK